MERHISEGTQVKVLADNIQEENGKYGWVDEPRSDEDEGMVLVEMKDTGKKYILNLMN